MELVAPMHRALMAILSINADTVVSTEQLIDELWQRQPPAGARATLQSYVSVLRRRCRQAGRPDLIETRPPGYRLSLATQESGVDTSAFRVAIAAAQQAAAAGDGDARLEHLRTAADLVSGPVLDDLTHLDTVRVFAADIAEQRRWVIHELVEIELAAGRAADVVPRLQELTRTEPLEERSWGLLMRALYHSGRQADALRSYQELRDVLVDQLGMEPCPEVRSIEQAILSGELGASAAPVPKVAQVTTKMVAPPHPISPLIGRTAELVQIDEALVDHRLVTITGTGGCGKTRLAAEAATTVGSAFGDVAWVELNTLEDGGAVEEAVAAGLGLALRTTDGLAQVAADRLEGRRVLVVIDNCEHVVDTVSSVAERLLQACPTLSVLATSRERLMVTGEYVLNLPPLASATPLELTRSRFEKPSEAASMFIDRAAIDAPEPDDLAVIEAICAQLDGIPLAIELAAPLAQTMTYDEIADRLLDRFRLLGETHRASRPQHRTLRAVVEWSHDILVDSERAAFAALSLFRGPFDARAAERLISAVGEDAGVQLPGLVRKSLVIADTTGGRTRYRLLETLRAFGAEQLDGDPAAREAAVDAFVGHFADEAQRWARHQQTATVSSWLRELGPDIANFQAAMALARAGDPTRGLAMVDAFHWYFNYIGQMAETRSWLAELIDADTLSAEERAVATVCTAALANFAGDYGATAVLGEAALDAARDLGDRRRLNAALLMRGTTATFEGDAGRAAECFIESAQLSEDLGDLGGVGASMAFWGIAHRRLRQFDDAKVCFDRAFEAFSRLADDRGMALVIGNTGRMAHQLGDVERGRELSRRGLEMARQSLDPMVSAQCALFCGHACLDAGEPGAALEYFEAALAHSLELGNRTMSSAAIEWMVVLGGAHADDVLLIDAFTQVRRNSPGTASPRHEWDAAVEQAIATVAEEARERLAERGRAMSLEAAIDHARAVVGRSLPPG